MALVLFDSNIIVDALNGIQEADDELFYYADAAISAVTWIEVIAGALPSNLQRCQRVLKTFQVIHTDDAIMTEAATI